MAWVLLLLCAGAVLARAEDAIMPFQNFGERWNHYVYRTYSWQRMGLLAADTGLDYVTGGLDEWGGGPAGYGSRYGFSFGRRVVQNSLELGFSAALRQDSRFRDSNLKGLRKRVRFALTHSLSAVSPEGRTEFAWSRLLATAGATAISTNWQPRPTTPGLLFANFSSGMLSHLENSLLNEFSPDMKRFGTRVRTKLFGGRAPR